MKNKILILTLGIILLSSVFVSAVDNKIWFGRNESNPSQMIPVLLTNTGVLRTDMNFSIVDIWNTNIGQLTNVNATQFNNIANALTIDTSWLSSFIGGAFFKTDGSSVMQGNANWNDFNLSMGTGLLKQDDGSIVTSNFGFNGTNMMWEVSSIGTPFWRIYPDTDNTGDWVYENTASGIHRFIGDIIGDTGRFDGGIGINVDPIILFGLRVQETANYVSGIEITMDVNKNEAISMNNGTTQMILFDSVNDDLISVNTGVFNVDFSGNTDVAILSVAGTGVGQRFININPAHANIDVGIFFGKPTSGEESLIFDKFAFPPNVGNMGFIFSDNLYVKGGFNTDDKVGINTLTPNATLHVVGNASITDDLFVSNVIIDSDTGCLINGDGQDMEICFNGSQGKINQLVGSSVLNFSNWASYNFDNDLFVVDADIGSLTKEVDNLYVQQIWVPSDDVGGGQPRRITFTDPGTSKVFEIFMDSNPFIFAHLSTDTTVMQFTSSTGQFIIKGDSTSDNPKITFRSILDGNLEFNIDAVFNPHFIFDRSLKVFGTDGFSQDTDAPLGTEFIGGTGVQEGVGGSHIRTGGDAQQNAQDGPVGDGGNISDTGGKGGISGGTQLGDGGSLFYTGGFGVIGGSVNLAGGIGSTTNGSINLFVIPEEDATATSMYVCRATDGHLFLNETGCRV